MSNHFDEFSKLVADGSIPRRESLQRLGLMITATILSPLGAQFARAGKTSKPPASPKPPQDFCKSFCQCRNKKQLDQCLKVCQSCGNSPSRVIGACGTYACCGSGLIACGTYCANLAGDPYNCGACGSVCSPPGPYEDVACISGQCEYACVEGAVYCDGACTFLDSDPDNCGACGNVCPASAPGCTNGKCGACQAGLTNCSGACTDLSSDFYNCGACGYVCDGFDYCFQGECWSDPSPPCDPDGPYFCP